MEIKPALIMDSADSLSKALPQLEEAPAVIITRNGKYYGIIDHRSVSAGLRNPANTKCETVADKPPVLSASANIIECMQAFSVGHFKALPVVDDDLKPLGITTRVELLKEMIANHLIPPVRVAQMMSTPVFTIDENETISSAKGRMKGLAVRRLVVTRNGKPAGVVSAFDIGAWESKPNLEGGRKDIHMSDSRNVSDVKISGFLRPDMAVVDEDASLSDAVGKMITKGVSSVVVVTDSHALGVLSALDIFKMVLEEGQDGTKVRVSGLSEEDESHHPEIVAKVGHVAERFGKTFNIRNVSVHVKRGKSTHVVNIYLDTDDGHISLKGERASLKETVDELAAELNEILRKKKEMRNPKPRAIHTKGRGKT